MTQPSLSIELALGMTPTDDWVWTNDISDLVRQRVAIRRGRRSIFSEIEAGRATITIDNRSRAYDPENTSSIYNADLLPLVPIRIQAIYDLDTYPLFWGFVTDWRPRHMGGTISYLDIVCTDGFELLSRYLIGTQDTPVVLAQDDVGQRIIDALDAAGWPGSGVGLSGGGTGPRVIDNSSALIIQESTLASVPALEHLQQVTRSVDGVFFMDNAGNATFQDRSYRDGLSSVKAFDNAVGSTDLPYKNLQTSFGVSQVFNRVEWQNQALPGETPVEITVEDSGSIAQYLARTLTRTSMLLHLDSDAITIATQLVARFKDPQVRAESITPTLSPSTDDSWPVVLAADISTKIDISRTSLNGGSDLALTGFVEGISWDITQAERGGTTWTCDLDISTL